jgi:hypothetical protein
MALEELHFLEQQMGRLDQEMAGWFSQHRDAVGRLAVIPGEFLGEGEGVHQLL